MEWARKKKLVRNMEVMLSMAGEENIHEKGKISFSLLEMRP
jgi:hypothetical protein